jgi:hypothetical protein
MKKENKTPHRKRISICLLTLLLDIFMIIVILLHKIFLGICIFIIVILVLSYETEIKGWFKKKEEGK